METTRIPLTPPCQVKTRNGNRADFLESSYYRCYQNSSEDSYLTLRHSWKQQEWHFHLMIELSDGDSVIWWETTLIDSEGLQKGVYPAKYVLGRSDSKHGNSCHKTGIRSDWTSQSSLVPVFATLAPILVVIIFVLWAGLQTNVSSNLVNRIGRHNRINDRLCNRLSRRPSGNDCLIGFMARVWPFMTPLQACHMWRFRSVLVGRMQKMPLYTEATILTQCR